jgi:homoserine kinase type II
MAQYTNLTIADISTILADYKLFSIKNWEVLSGGSENTNYLIDCESGTYVLTVCERKTVEGATHLAQLLAYLAQNKFETSKIVANKNQALVSVYKKKAILLKVFLEGHIRDHFPNHLLALVGQQMANLHQIAAPDYMSTQYSYGKESFDEINNYEGATEFSQWLMERKAYILNNIPADLPKALIHGDIFDNNIILNEAESKAVIMDFEEACYYYRGFDLGMTLIGLCSIENTLDAKKTMELLSGYQQVMPLTNKELRALKAFAVYAATATAFWRYRQFYFIEPLPAMQNHYLKMTALADNILALPTEFFLK